MYPGVDVRINESVKHISENSAERLTIGVSYIVKSIDSDIEHPSSEVIVTDIWLSEIEFGV